MEKVMEMDKASMQPGRVHPHKFALWVAMGSISMMFAGLTSAYMVREAQGNWRYYKLPPVFWYSTIVILLSSVTFVMALQAFKKRKMARYKTLMITTILAGILFGVMQYDGFYQLYHQLQHVNINGRILSETATVRVNGNPSESFLFIIAGLHLAHLLGGIVAMVIVYFRSIRTRVKVYNTTGLEIAGGYWHFVDALWLYLFIFFLVNQ